MHTAKEVDARITAYLSGGGLFNPEFATHDAVRDLLIDARDALKPLLASVEDAEGIVRELGGFVDYLHERGHDGDAELVDHARAMILSQREREKRKGEEIERVKVERDSLKAFRNYFADKCEGLFFQFGMEVIDLYNATHGYKACHIEPDRAAHPKDAPKHKTLAQPDISNDPPCAY